MKSFIVDGELACTGCLGKKVSSSDFLGFDALDLVNGFRDFPKFCISFNELRVFLNIAPVRFSALSIIFIGDGRPSVLFGAGAEDDLNGSMLSNVGVAVLPLPNGHNAASGLS